MIRHRSRDCRGSCRAGDERRTHLCTFRARRIAALAISDRKEHFRSDAVRAWRQRCHRFRGGVQARRVRSASDGVFYVVLAATGKKLWSYDVGVPIATAAVAADGGVFAASYDGALYRFSV